MLIGLAFEALKNDKIENLCLKGSKNWQCSDYLTAIGQGYK
jgi:hypothetical protein